jgi:[ribosomal protein S5]-alanine N-acetyltransferase
VISDDSSGPALEPLRAEHGPALLAFELANRAYFARFISDRGDAYFLGFADDLAELLAEQDAGEAAYHVLVDDDGAVLGRFNLRDIRSDHPGGGTAVLGYRVAEHVAGRGVATATVERLCREAADRLGIDLVRAATSTANLASTRVLLKAGFVRVGDADPGDLGGKAGSWYEWRAGAVAGAAQDSQDA